MSPSPKRVLSIIVIVNSQHIILIRHNRVNAMQGLKPQYTINQTLAQIAERPTLVASSSKRSQALKQRSYSQGV